MRRGKKKGGAKSKKTELQAKDGEARVPEDEQFLEDLQMVGNEKQLNVEELEVNAEMNGEKSANGIDRNDDEPEGDIETNEEVPDDHVVEPKRKRHRGPTKMKDIAKDPNHRQRVDFTFMGEPYGPGSVKLSSYLGPLVREHVPYTLNEWKELSEGAKTVLWKSIQARFAVDEEYQRTALLKQMGCLWRASKSRLVKKILAAETNQARMNLRPNNISPVDWRKFVKIKTSQEFKVVSDSYKERRSLQIPHTCSRKGMVRLAEDMKSESTNPSEVTRLKVWVKSRTKKDGTPVNTTAADKFRKVAELIDSDAPLSEPNPGEDILSQLLGPDNPGRLRAMGRNMNKTKLACFQVKQKSMAEMEKNQVQLVRRVIQLEGEIENMKNQRQEPEVGENSAAKSVNKRSHPMCVLIDWADDDKNVAEGHIIPSDPEDLVNDSKLGPSDLKVLVDSATIPDAFLWRPTTNMFTIEEAVGKIVAWPASKTINLQPSFQPEDIAPTGSRINSVNKCKLLDLSDDDIVVAEGRWQTKEPKAMVNGLPLGPNAVKVYVDVILQNETFIWRPTKEVSYLEDCLMSFVSWPASKVLFEPPVDATDLQNSASTNQASKVKSAASGLKSADTAGQKSAATSTKSPTQISPPTGLKTLVEESSAVEPKSLVKKIKLASVPQLRRSPRKNGGLVVKPNQKCKLMDINGMKRVVAEGRWHSNNPDQKVHFVQLGQNAARVWVDIVKVNDAAVWRPSEEIEFMRDALGTSIAWPEDKLVIC